MTSIESGTRGFRSVGYGAIASSIADALVVVALAMTPAVTIATTDSPVTASAPASATLPLDDILHLYRENEAASRTVDPLPPVDAAVHRIELHARLLDAAVSTRARFQVTVLTENEWVSVPLLAVGPGTLLSDLPTPKDSVLTIVDGHLTLVTRKRGEFDFAVEFLQLASVDGQRRRAQIVYPAATFAVGHLSFDKGLFRVEETIDGVGVDGVVYPREGVFDLEWHREFDARPTTGKSMPAPAIESVIPSAHASIVSTLEGTHIIRLLYRLRFAGRKSLIVDIPAGHRVERGYLNGVSIPVTVSDGQLALEVSPSQAGEEGGTLELITFVPSEGYLLSGTFGLELPRTSWRINELFISAHLPPVFDYSWVGGTLSPAKHVPAVSFSYDIPTPGRRLDFHQFLVHTSLPTLTLGYEVSLEGQYFRAAR